MPLKSLLRHLLNNDRIVQQLADSYPMRQFARFCLSIFYRAQDVTKQNAFQGSKSNVKWLKSFYNTFIQNLSNEMKMIRDQTKYQNKKK